MRNLIFLSIFSSLGIIAFGQSKYQNLSTSSKKAIEDYEEADFHYVRKDYVSAIEFLQRAIKRDDQFIEAYFRLGNSFYWLGDTAQARVNWEDAIALAGETPDHVYLFFFIGRLYYETEEYIKARDAFGTYLKLVKTDSRQHREVEFLHKCADFAVSSIAMNLDFKPRPLAGELNRFALQYFPVMPADKQSLIFTRRQGLDPSDDEDLYISYKDSLGTWRTPETLSHNINTVFNEGTCAISADGRMLIFTSCYGREGYGSCDLFVSYKTGNNWSEPENLGPQINTGAWESQPSLSADGRTLYFISDRNGGFGRRDVWVCKKDKEGQWGRAINLGAPVNTTVDEVSPFIHPNGQRLYFASKGHVGLGGFDIYFSEINDMGWDYPVNIGYPLNTGQDEVSLYITPDGINGYYSRDFIDKNRRKRSLIYEIDIPESLQIINKSSFVKGQVFDSETKLPLGAVVELADLLKSEKISIVSSDSVTGNYLMVLTEGAEYGLYISSVGYVFKSLSFRYEDKDSIEPIVIDVYLDPVKAGVSTVLNNIFFEFDAFDIEPKSKTELAEIIQFLNTNPEVSIRIEGHTDNTGSAVYNNDLSTKRAMAVYDYLLGNGISEERLSYKGFGMTKPLVENTSESNKALNRRIEFRILALDP